MLAHVLVVFGLLGIALLLGACVYESVIMAPNFARDIPSSIEDARRFLSRRHPGQYFRVLAPVTQVVFVLCAFLTWGTPDLRWNVLIALGALVLTDVITFTYHYPRLAIMFRQPIPADPEPLRRATSEWAAGNVVRTVLLLVAFCFALHAIIEGAHHIHG